MSHVNSPTDREAFTACGVSSSADLPDDRWRDGRQFPVLSNRGGKRASALPACAPVSFLFP